MDNLQVGESYAQQNTSDERVLSNFEIVPQHGETSRAPKRSISWKALETFVLLEAWGEKLLRSSRRSVQSAEWDEVAEKVSEVSKCTRTQTHCRHRLDTLKRLYKKEKAKFAENADYASDWLFFSKMDSVVSSSLNPGIGIVDNEIYPSHSSSLDEMRNELLGDDANSPGTESDSFQILTPSKKRKMEKDENLGDTRPQKRMARKERGGYRLIVASLNKFIDRYEKVEKKKIEQMIELEKTRMAFQKDLELERIKSLYMWEVEMAKIRRTNID